MPRKVWDQPADDLLRELWGRDPQISVDEIAAQFNVKHTTIYNRAQALSLPLRGRPHGYNGVGFETPRPMVNRDDAYVAACLAQGGFKVLHVEYRR
jgi:hypothetical protein